jgi:NADH-quinone oxidoreductase subunit I
MDKVAEHSSAWVRATAPSGAAAFEGKVAWSGELGFGVKPPELGQTAEDPKLATPSRQDRDQLSQESDLHDHDHGGGHH